MRASPTHAQGVHPRQFTQDTPNNEVAGVRECIENATGNPSVKAVVVMPHGVTRADVNCNVHRRVTDCKRRRLERHARLFIYFYFLFHPIYYLHLSFLFYLPRSRSSDPGLHSTLVPPSPLRFVSSILIARRLELFLSSLTRVEIYFPTLGALSSGPGDPFFFFFILQKNLKREKHDGGI